MRASGVAPLLVGGPRRSLLARRPASDPRKVNGKCTIDNDRSIGGDLCRWMRCLTSKRPDTSVSRIARGISPNVRTERYIFLPRGDKMRGFAIRGLLSLVGICVVLADPKADPSEELFNRLQLPKNRNEDKCYDENGRPQVRLDCLYA